MKISIELETADAKWLSGWIDTILNSIPMDQLSGDTLHMSAIARDIQKSIDGEPKSHEIAEVYDYYLEQFHKSAAQYKLTPARRHKIKMRLKDAGMEMVKKAISNTAHSDFHTGDNERNWKADLDFIVRSYEQLEKLANTTSMSAKPDINSLDDMESLL